MTFQNDEYTAKLQTDGQNTDYTLHIYKIANSGFRFRVDPGEKLSRYRFNITTDDVIVNSSTISAKQPLTLTKENELHLLLDSENQELCTISLSPFSVTFSKNGKSLLSLNSNDFMYIESQTTESHTSEQTENTLTEETTKNGNTSVGIDATFHSNRARLSGFIEGSSSINLEDTGDSPMRRYSRSSYTNYGFVPLLIGHCPDFGGFSPSLFWMNPTDMFLDLKTRSNERQAKLIAEGGFIDLVVFLDTMANNLRQYTLLTGTSAMPPVFALGYHQSKFGYTSQEEVEEILSEFERYMFPNDAIWLDIDHLSGYAPFSVNSTWLTNPQRLFTNQAAKKRYVIRITDPHLPVDDKHKQYQSAHDLKYFVTNSSNEEAHGTCWPGLSAWPDFFRSEVRKWWAEQFSYATDSVNWAPNVYLWNDMNEIEAFDQLEKTAAKDWQHFNGTIEERETHSAYGLFMAAASYAGLLSRDSSTLRPFVLTRSFFAGAQKYAWFWSGDNSATWDDLSNSLQAALAGGLAGVPFTGSDVGGYSGKPSDELYVRWFQTAAYSYPFFRQHSSNESARCEPFLLNATNAAAFSAVLAATQNRYRLLGVWYTAAHRNTETGQPIVTPLWYHYPDSDLFHDAQPQFLLDGRIMVRPVVEEGAKTVNVAKPDGKWYNLWTGEELRETADVPVALADTPVYVKGGTIVPVFNQTAMTARDQIAQPIELVIAVDENQEAEGDLFLDDGVTLNYTNGEAVYTKFRYSNGHFELTASGKSQNVTNVVSSLRIYGFASSRDDTEFGGTHTMEANNVVHITGLSYKIDTDYKTKKIGTDFPLWIIAICVGVVMVVLIVLMYFYVRSLNYVHRAPVVPNDSRVSYTESTDPSHLLHNDPTKSVI